MNELHEPLVIGVGNVLRGDDAAGILAARAVRQAGCEVRELEEDATALIDAWSDRSAVVVIDTMRSGARPGTIVRLDASRVPLPRRAHGASSSHAVGVGEAIELARALGRLPRRLVVYGIEGARFQAGESLSPTLEAALPDLIAMVLAEVRTLRGAAAESAVSRVHPAQ